MLGLFYQSTLVKDLGRNLVAGIEIRLDLAEADLDPVFLEDVGEATLREATLEWHLPAFKSRTARITRTRFLALVSTTGRLSKSRTGTATNALFLMGRSRGRM